MLTGYQTQQRLTRLGIRPRGDGLAVVSDPGEPDFGGFKFFFQSLIPRRGVRFLNLKYE